MTQYISKSTLVSEVDKLYNENYKFLPSDLVESVQDFKDDLLIVLDNLEVKDADFETDFAASIDYFDEKNNYGKWPESDLRDFAKHFFELGIKSTERKQ